MIENEVKLMENNKENMAPEEQEKYEPRPQWQVNMARIGLVFFIAFVIWQLCQIAGGGL